MQSLSALYEKYHGDIDIENFIAYCDKVGCTTETIQNGIDAAYVLAIRFGLKFSDTLSFAMLLMK